MRKLVKKCQRTLRFQNSLETGLPTVHHHLSDCEDCVVADFFLASIVQKVDEKWKKLLEVVT